MKQLIGISLCLCLAVNVVAQDSPCFRGPDHSGTYPDGKIRTNWKSSPPKVLWKKKDIGYGFSQVVVAGKNAVTCGYEINGDKALLYCFDADTGEQKWKIEYKDTCVGQRGAVRGAVATPAISSGRIYVSAIMGKLYCFDLKDGTEIWSKVTNKDAQAGKPYGDYGDGVSPIVTEGMVVANLSASLKSSAWYGMSATDGSIAWTHPIVKRETRRKREVVDRAYAGAVPCVVNGKPHVTLVANASIDCVDTRTGAPAWSHSLEDLKISWGPFPEPSYFEADKFFLGIWYSAQEQAFAFEVKGKELKRSWKNRSIGLGAYSHVVHDGYVYGYGSKGLQCVDLKNGDVKWDWRSDDQQLARDQGEIICVGDKLVWMSTSGMLYVRQASPDKGGPIAGMNVFGACPKDTKKDLAGYNGKVTSSPTFANGRLYCRAPWGEVVCLDVKP